MPVKGSWQYDPSYPPLVDAKNRRSLTPSTGMSTGDDVHATRRGGARHEVSSRVTLTARPGAKSSAAAGAVFEGWALNVSRGGVRVILEENVELGSEFDVTLSTGEDTSRPQVGRVVWVQEEPDGVVAGIEFC